MAMDTYTIIDTYTVAAWCSISLDNDLYPPITSGGHIPGIILTSLVVSVSQYWLIGSCLHIRRFLVS